MCILRFTSRVVCNSSCFKQLLLKITVRLPHFQEIALNTFLSSVTFPCTLFKSLNEPLSNANQNAFLGVLDLACKDCRSPALCVFPCFWMPYRPLSLPASQLPAAKKPPLQTWGTLMSPVWLPLPLGVFKQGCLWVPLSSCTATFTSTNTTSLCNHLPPWEMTEGVKKKKRKGRNQDDRLDLGDPGDPGWTNLDGRHESGFNNIIRQLTITFQELILSQSPGNVP